MDLRTKVYQRINGRSNLVSGALLVVALATSASTLAASKPGGKIDGSFGDKGIVYYPDSGMACNQANETLLQPDGKLVSAVSCPERLVRHLSDGSLDTSFGGVGYVSAPEKGVAIQADGKLVAVDEVSVGFPRFGFRVQRFNPDGSIDTTFGDNGTAIAEFDPVLEPVTRQGYDVAAADVVVQSDGKIAVAGTYNYYLYDGFTYSRRPIAQALARFNADGTPDAGFGIGGQVIQDTIPAADPNMNPRESVQSLVQQPNGQLVVAGYLESNDIDMMATRYNVDGTPDPFFGSGGVAVVDLAANEFGRDLALQSDGKIVVVGRREAAGFTSADMAVVRLQSNGSLDSGFGVSGSTVTDYDGLQDGAEAVAIQADGRIVTGGFVTRAKSSGIIIGVVRYGVDGALDGTFGQDGIVTTEIKDSQGGAKANDVLIQPDGKIVASGTVMVRYLP